ncbi:MAG: hypothetical protein AAF366_12025 [Pseudomonadota bacterium]
MAYLCGCFGGWVLYDGKMVLMGSRLPERVLADDGIWATQGLHMGAGIGILTIMTFAILDILLLSRS